MTKIYLNKNTINFRNVRIHFGWIGCMCVCLLSVGGVVSFIEMRIVSFASFLSKKSYCHILLLIIGTFVTHYAILCCILCFCFMFYIFPGTPILSLCLFCICALLLFFFLFHSGVECMLSHTQSVYKKHRRMGHTIKNSSFRFRKWK